MGKFEAVKALLEAKADFTIPEKDGYTVFHAAGFQGREQIIKLLAEFKDDKGDTIIKDTMLMSQHEDGYYPIHRSCWGRQPRHAMALKAFLDLGVPYDLEAANGKTCETMMGLPLQLLTAWEPRGAGL